MNCACLQPIFHARLLCSGLSDPKLEWGDGVSGTSKDTLLCPGLPSEVIDAYCTGKADMANLRTSFIPLGSSGWWWWKHTDGQKMQTTVANEHTSGWKSTSVSENGQFVMLNGTDGLSQELPGMASHLYNFFLKCALCKSQKMQKQGCRPRVTLELCSANLFARKILL